MRGELQRVVQVVRQDLPHPQRIATHQRGQRRVELRFEGQAVAGGQCGIGALHRPQQRAQVEGLGLHVELAGLYLGQVEDLADDRRQQVGALADLVQVLAQPLGRHARLAGQAGQPGQAVQRRADFVAGVGQKGALGPAGGFGSVARAGQRLLGQTLGGHVFGDPDRAAMGQVERVDRLGAQPHGEAAAVAAPALALQIDRLAAQQRRADGKAQCFELHRVVPQRLQRQPRQAVWAPAVHLLKPGVGHDEPALAREGDADRGVGQDGLELQPGPCGLGHVARVR